MTNPYINGALLFPLRNEWIDPLHWMTLHAKFAELVTTPSRYMAQQARTFIKRPRIPPTHKQFNITDYHAQLAFGLSLAASHLLKEAHQDEQYQASAVQGGE